MDLRIHVLSSNLLLHNMLAQSASISGTVCAIYWSDSGDGFGTVLPGEATTPGSCMALQTDAQISGLYWPSDTQMGNPIQTSCSCFQ